MDPELFIAIITNQTNTINIAILILMQRFAFANYSSLKPIQNQLGCIVKKTKMDV